jgi:hypothetical protein
MDAGNWIALTAVVLSVLVAIRGELSVRGERRARAREDRRRDEELHLLRAQVEGEAEHRLSELRAHLVCSQGARGGTGVGMDEYSIALLNAGKTTAHDVRAWIATEDGEALSVEQRPGALVPGADRIWFTLSLAHEHSRDQNSRIFLRAAWTDGTGDHEENIEELEHV